MHWICLVQKGSGLTNLSYSCECCYDVERVSRRPALLLASFCQPAPKSSEPVFSNKARNVRGLS
jgi:hypothetical protein